MGAANTTPDKYIFLDIDGVLNSQKTRVNDPKNIDRTLTKNLSVIVKATKAKIVLSSTWRLEKEWKKDV